jgi:hypothetical protein
MMQKRDDRQIKQDFKLRQNRQFLAISLTVLLLVFLTLLYKRPDLFGEFSKNSVFATEVLLIAAFIVFSAFNWRCPSCNKYLGNDINRHICKNCGTRLR